MSISALHSSTAISAAHKTGVAYKASHITIEQFVFYFALVIYVFSTVWNRITFSSYFADTVDGILTAFDATAAFLILIKIMLQGFSNLREVISVVALGLLGIASWYITKTTAIFWLAVLVAAGKNTTLRGISRAIFFGLLSSFVMALFGLGFGFVTDHLVVRNGVQRFALGFSHPNYLGIVCFSLILSFRLSGFTRSRIIYVAMCAVLGWTVYFFADTRTGLLSILILMAFILAWPAVRSEWASRLKKALCVLCAILLIYSLVTMVIYTPTNPILAAINNAMTGRLYCANHFYNIFPPNILGRTVDDASVISAGGWFTFMVDNVYCHLLIRYGVVPFALIVLGFLVYFKKEAHRPRCTLAYFLLPTAMVAGLSEATVLLVGNNPLMLLLIPVVHSIPLSEFDNTEGTCI